MQNKLNYSFPSNTRKNRKECMDVTLRSGKELEERRVENKDTEERNMQKLEKNLSSMVHKQLKKIK